MDTFVVRIYRPGAGAAQQGTALKGVVEEISSGCQATFQNSRQLLSILVSGAANAPPEDRVDADDPHSRPVRSDETGLQ